MGIRHFLGKKAKQNKKGKPQNPANYHTRTSKKAYG